MKVMAGLLGVCLKTILGFVGSYGIAIIVFTIIIKTILLPLTIKQTKSTFAMSEIQPKIKEIQAKYKNKPEKQSQEISKIYKEAKVNPLAGCLPLLVQMPILMGLYWALRDPVTSGVFASQAEYMANNGQFLWMKSLTEPDYVLAVISGISAFGMQKLMTPKDQLQGNMKIMTYVMAGMSLYWGIIFPAGLSLYWVMSNLFSIVQFYFITKPLKAKLENEKQARGR